MATTTYRSGNPTLDDSIFQANTTAPGAAATMTVQGVAVKTLFLLVLVVLAAGFTYYHTWELLRYEGVEVRERAGRLNSLSHLPGEVVAYLIIGSLAAFGVALYVSFNPSHAPVGACVYALFEGAALGAWSQVFEFMYPGVVPQAVGLTFGTLGALLLGYISGVIRGGARFRAVVIAATGGVALVYLVDLVLALFNLNVPLLHETGVGGVIVSLIVVVIAAANLVIDFEFIEEAVRYRSAKYMEWYAGFGLLVTLVWLYLELVRLLAKLRSER